MKKVLVIGSGFAGLSAACHLAAKGYDVAVVEKHNGPGGRCRVWETDGFRFDMGPSWYWMPDVFEKFFADFGKQVSDYYELQRLDPSYRVFFSAQDIWDIPASAEALGEMLNTIEPGASQSLKKFLDEASYKYEVGIQNLVYKPGRKLSELMDKKLISGLFKLDVFKSMSKHIDSLFKDARIKQLLEFPVLFLGAKPQDTPALYSLMNYADIALGTWYPKGGMHEIVQAMYKLAQELGVKFHFNHEVKQIIVEGKSARRVLTNQGEYKADLIVGGADYHHLETLLPEHRNYSEAYWDKRVMAPSSLIYYVGFSEPIPGLLHHNLFFDQDFVRHAKEIYDSPAWPENPLFYVSCTSKTDDTVAPEGKENVFILIPVAPGMKDTPEIKERYFQLVMDRMEALLGRELRSKVEVRRDYAQSDFISDYHSFKGNAYGLANTLMQTAHLKPSLKNKNLNNFYYTGQLTVPGPGVPPAIISGEVVAAEIANEHPLTV
ncbi:MAG: phytoene desaturase [Bacteroidetes bacterium]|nr:MAG: phytoene desaturase [Bacteroidota bacterium]